MLWRLTAHILFYGHLWSSGHLVGWNELKKSSTERASPTGSAQGLIFSRRSSYIPAAVQLSILMYLSCNFSGVPGWFHMATSLYLAILYCIHTIACGLLDCSRPHSETRRKSIFYHISNNLRKDIKINALQRLYPTFCRLDRHLKSHPQQV